MSEKKEKYLTPDTNITPEQQDKKNIEHAKRYLKNVCSIIEQTSQEKYPELVKETSSSLSKKEIESLSGFLKHLEAE